MTLTLAFTVPGPPVPKQRPRRGKGGHFYTPGETQSYEQTVAVYALSAMRSQRWPTRYTGPCGLTVHVYLPTARRIDLDNCVKAIQDAINEKVIEDDSQIIEVHAYKTVQSPDPRVDVELRAISEARA